MKVRYALKDLYVCNHCGGFGDQDEMRVKFGPHYFGEPRKLEYFCVDQAKCSDRLEGQDLYQLFRYGPIKETTRRPKQNQGKPDDDIPYWIRGGYVYPDEYLTSPAPFCSFATVGGY